MNNAPKGVFPVSPAGMLALARPQVAVLVALSVVSNILMLTGSIFMLQVYDRVLPSRSMPTLIALTLLVVVLYGFYALIEWIRSRMTNRFGGILALRLSAPVLRASVRQKLIQSNGRRAETLRDLDALQGFVSGSGAIALFDLPWFPLYLALVFGLHPLLGLTAVAGAVVICGLLVVNEANSRQPGLAVTTANMERNAMATDTVSNAEAVVAMGMLGTLSNRWTDSVTNFLRVQQRAADRATYYSSITKGFRYLLQSAVLGVGAFLVIRGDVTGGVMIAASILTSRALAPVEQVVGHWRSFVNARQAATRIQEALVLADPPSPATELPLPYQTVTVSNLFTGPHPRGLPTAGNVQFTLQAGDGLGIIGPSGSGKSSVGRALVGVWPLLNGEIRFDGYDAAHYDSERLAQVVGYLPQTVELFDGTIADNISHFAPIRDPDKILKAAAAARVGDLIAGLPDGYDTRIGEGGSVLSAGQRQRIGLARALYGDPFLIVLDEPNSNLDSEGDEALTRALFEARKRGAIVVVIAHRPSAIAAVDKLLFMRDGRQAAFGSKEAVLRDTTQPRIVTNEEHRSGQDGRGPAKIAGHA